MYSCVSTIICGRDAGDITSHTRAARLVWVDKIWVLEPLPNGTDNRKKLYCFIEQPLPTTNTLINQLIGFFWNNYYQISKIIWHCYCILISNLIFCVHTSYTKSSISASSVHHFKCLISVFYFMCKEWDSRNGYLQVSHLWCR